LFQLQGVPAIFSLRIRFRTAPSEAGPLLTTAHATFQSAPEKALWLKANKKPATWAGFFGFYQEWLSDFAFLVHHVFAHDRVIFFDFYFSGGVFLFLSVV
jgi:hypothetical protein